MEKKYNYLEHGKKKIFNKERVLFQTELIHFDDLDDQEEIQIMITKSNIFLIANEGILREINH